MTSWNDIVEQHYNDNIRRLRNSLYRNCGDATEDIIHNAYERVLRYQSAFKPDKDFNTWFTTILRNCIIDHKREEKGRVEPQLPQELDEFDHIGGTCSGVVDKIWKEVNQLISQESEEHQEVLELYFILGYSYHDISKLTRYSYFNAYRVINTFKKKLVGKYKQ